MEEVELFLQVGGPELLLVEVRKPWYYLETMSSIHRNFTGPEQSSYENQKQGNLLTIVSSLARKSLLNDALL